jgi:asparagine synthase (glutamine-hydrolysing)
MPDFLIMFDPLASAAHAERALQNRPGVHNLPASSFSFPWGCLTVQAAHFAEYAPHSCNGSVACAVGRAGIDDSQACCHSERSFTRVILEWDKQGELERRYAQLSGMFAVCIADSQAVRIVTDPLGFYAVYVATSRDGRYRAIGTQPELVAAAAGRADDYDAISLGEILVRHVATFPFTTRRGMCELEPGSIHRFAINHGNVAHAATRLWQPDEPSRWPSLDESRSALLEAIRRVSKRITRHRKSVAVLLSGGTDSRTVLASIPAPLRAGAITFADHEVRELATARQIAAAAGVPHRVAWRDPEFYSSLFLREAALLGQERAAWNAHGFAVQDSGAARDFDLLVGGFMSDTLLKALFSRYSVKDHLLWSAGLGRMSERRVASRARYGPEAAILPVLRGEICQGVLWRRAERIQRLRAIRPLTADDWAVWYPMSRQPDVGYAQANMRLFPADELFIHREIVEVARIARFIHKKSRELVRQVFARIGGPLARIENSNTYLPANSSLFRESLFKRHPGSRLGGTQRDASFPWLTDALTVDLAVLLECSPRFAELRCAASQRSDGIDVLAGVLNDPRSALKAVRPDRAPRFHYTMVQMASLLGGSTAAAAHTPVFPPCAAK